MKKSRRTLKKLCALILCVLMMASVFSVVSFAADGDVARLSVVSCVTTKDIFGHAWIYVENLSNEPIIVGLYELQPGDGVSIGTGKNHRGDGAGIYYNVESYLINHRESAQPRYSKTIDINAEQLQKVSKTINENNVWKVHINCSNFAEKVFNSAGETRVYCLGTPSFLKTYIKLFLNGRRDLPHKDVRPDQCFKQNGNTLKVVSQKSISYPF